DGARPLPHPPRNGRAGGGRRAARARARDLRGSRSRDGTARSRDLGPAACRALSRGVAAGPAPDGQIGPRRRWCKRGGSGAVGGGRDIRSPLSPGPGGRPSPGGIAAHTKKGWESGDVETVSFRNTETQGAPTWLRKVRSPPRNG